MDSFQGDNNVNDHHVDNILQNYTMHERECTRTYDSMKPYFTTIIRLSDLVGTSVHAINVNNRTVKNHVVTLLFMELGINLDHKKSTSLISLILVPLLPMKEPHCVEGKGRLKLTPCIGGGFTPDWLGTAMESYSGE